MVQPQSVVRPKFTLPALQATLKAFCDKEIVHPACVTVTATGLHPGTVTVMVATLEAQDVLAEYVATMVALPLPEFGEMVHQAWLLVAVHATLLVTEKLVEPTAAGTF